MKVLSIFLLIAIASVSSAFDDFDVHCANIAILQDKRVQSEIKITPVQHDRLTKLAAEHTARLQAYQKQLNGAQPNPSTLGQYILDLKGKVVTVLTPAQLKRLRELNLQAAGLRGLLDSVVAKRVGIPDAQLKNMQQIYQSGSSSATDLLRTAMQPIDQKYKKLAQPYNADPKGHQAELQKLSKDYAAEAAAAQKKITPRLESITNSTEKKLLATLTAQQKATWTALQGTKFVPAKK